MDTPDFGAIGTDAHALFNLINEQMNMVTVEDPEWHRLYDMFRLVSVVCSLASDACNRQLVKDALTDQTAPYWPTSPEHGNPSHRTDPTGCDQCWQELPPEAKSRLVNQVSL